MKSECDPSESANGAGEGARQHGTGAESVDSAEGSRKQEYDYKPASAVRFPAAPAVQGGLCEVDGGGAAGSSSELGRGAVKGAYGP